MDIDAIANSIDYEKNMHKKINNMLLTNNQIEILEKYNINYNNCNSMNELLYFIDEILDEMDNEELERISLEIAETNYYMNTNK